MKTRVLVFAFIAAAATSAHADTLNYAQCGTYDSYLLIYKTTDRFEELGKLRCDEQVEVLSQSGGYSQVRTLDGRVGWVRDADLSGTPPPPHRSFTLGMTEHVSDVQLKPASDSPLVNDDILAMSAKHVGSDPMLKRISSSPCAFDTSPEALRMLRTAGLPGKVILAMIEAPVAPGAIERRAPGTFEVRIPDGTPLEVELNRNVLSEDAEEGSVVEMSAAEDLVVDGALVILRGSTARARVMAVQRGSHGDSGRVAWFMQDIVAVTGDHIPVTFASKQPGKNRSQDFEGYSFFLSEFHKGGPAIKATDKRFRVVIHGDTVLRISRPLTADLPTPTPKPSAESVRQVSAEPIFPSQIAPSPEPSESNGLKP